MPEFLLQSPQGWPKPAPGVFINEPSEESKMAVSPSPQVDYIKGVCEPKLSPSSETDPSGLSAKQPGAKLDRGKVDTLRGAIQYFPMALEAVAHVSELGAKKYSWMGWKSVPDGIRRYGAALARHLVYEADARDTGAGGLGPDVLHAAQVAWNALARLELVIKEENDKAQSQAAK
jgi:hypothetical protein